MPSRGAAPKPPPPPTKRRGRCLQQHGSRLSDGSSAASAVRSVGLVPRCVAGVGSRKRVFEGFLAGALRDLVPAFEGGGDRGSPRARETASDPVSAPARSLRSDPDLRLRRVRRPKIAGAGPDPLPAPRRPGAAAVSSRRASMPLASLRGGGGLAARGGPDPPRHFVCVLLVRALASTCCLLPSKAVSPSRRAKAKQALARAARRAATERRDRGRPRP
jgi:hypothetical protein